MKNSPLKTNFTSWILKLGYMRDSQLAKCKITTAAGFLRGYLWWTLKRTEKWTQKMNFDTARTKQWGNVLSFVFSHGIADMLKNFLFFLVFPSLKAAILFLTSIALGF